MQFSARYFTVCIALTVLSVCDAFFFTGDRDCEVSNWSPWTTKPGFTVRSRERAILAYATGNGSPCPDVSMLLETTSPSEIKDTAVALKTHFLKRQGVMKNGTRIGLKRDLLVIIDSSGSIGTANFTIAKNQTARLLGLLCPVNDPFERQRNIQRAALIEYSSAVKQVFDFDDKANTAQIQQTIKDLGYMGHSTCTATAFREAENMFRVDRGMRTDPDVKQEVLILTDGLSNCGGNATVAAELLQSTAGVYALRIGKFTPKGEAELQSYVSKPPDQHLFAISGYQILQKLLDELELQIGLGPPCAPFDLTNQG